MIKRGLLLLQFFLVLLFTANVYSLEIEKFKHAALTQDVKAKKIISELLQKHDTSNQAAENLNRLMNMQLQKNHEIMQELQTNINSLVLAKKLSIKIPEQIIYSSHPLDIGNETKINFLDLRLNDAYLMLEVLRNAPQLTLDNLIVMREIAASAKKNCGSDSDCYIFDTEFQLIKSSIYYVQYAGLIDGLKIVSGGDLKINFGDNNKDSATLLLKIPAFDPESLAVSTLTLETQADAEIAYDKISLAIEQVEKCLAIVNKSGLIADAEAMLLSIPYMLNQNLTLMHSATDVIVETLDDALSDSEREPLEIEFDYLKAAMTKTQTYLSLNGPKMLGGGKISIEIGHSLSTLTRLYINIPVTDVKKLGLDKLHINTEARASHALDAVLEAIHDFTYSPGN